MNCLIEELRMNDGAFDLWIVRSRQ